MEYNWIAIAVVALIFLFYTGALFCFWLYILKGYQKRKLLAVAISICSTAWFFTLRWFSIGGNIANLPFWIMDAALVVHWIQVIRKHKNKSRNDASSVVSKEKKTE